MPRVVPEYKEEARNRIVSAAVQVFREKGYRQATMDDVAKNVGVSKGALYLYFTSKEDLFGAICRSEPLQLRDILFASFRVDKDYLQGASDFFDKMVERYGSNYSLSFEIFSEASRNPTLRKVLRKTQDEYANVLMSFLAQLREKGYVWTDFDLRSLTYASIGLWNGIETLIVTGLPLPEAREAWLEGFKALFTHSSSKNERAN